MFHTPRPKDEVDFFPESKAIIAINSPSGSEELTLIGPTTVIVTDVRNPQDADGNGREEVATEIVQMRLTGTSALFGPITVSVRVVGTGLVRLDARDDCGEVGVSLLLSTRLGREWECQQGEPED